MSEDLIRRSDAIKALDANFTIKGKENMQTVLNYLELVRTRIEGAPSIEPKRGKWGLMRTVKYNSRPEHWLKCSACGNFRIIKVGEAFPSFCENCGAEMRKGADDEMQ